MEQMEFDDFLLNYPGLTHGYFTEFGVVETTVNHSLVYCTNVYYLQKALASRHVSAIIISRSLIEQLPASANKLVLISSRPGFDFWLLFSKMVDEGYVCMKMDYGVDPSSRIDSTAVVSDKVSIGKNVVIGPQAVLGDNVILADNVEIGPGVIVGTDGLQVVSAENKTIHISHAGGVRIGRNSKVLANSVIARGVFPVWTEIGTDTYIALLVSIGHQSRIGSRCQISSNVVIGGSASIGDDAWIGPSATVSSSVSVAAGAQVKLGSVVIRNVDKGAVVSGNFAGDHLVNIKSFLSR
jgi:UDP-3-O-[3-hydroxymyristoyl] glucosamine N-acyltransferase